MFKFVLVTLLLTSTLGQSFLANKVGNTQDFITGFLIGNISHSYLGSGLIVRVPHAFPCAVVAESAQTKIGEAVAQIKSGGVDNIVAGVQALTAVIDQLANDCGNAVDDVNSLVHEVTAIVTGMQNNHIVAPHFAKDAGARLYAQAERVGRDIAEVVVAKNNHEALLEGLRIGDIVSIVLWE